MTSSNNPNLGCEDVCNLPSDELKDRSATLRREVLPHVIGREELAEGMAFEFAYTPAMQTKLEGLVAFERECCGGLAWNLHRPKRAVLRLSVEGLSPDSDFFRALGGEASTPVPGHMKRLAKAGGFGAVTAILLCCVVPIGFAAVLGAAVATPFAMLDDPFVIAIGTVLLAVPAWLWLRRRDAGACGDDC